MLSFVAVVHEAPSLLGKLPPADLQSLSATCKSLRTLCCAQVTIMSPSASADLSKLCCTAWPQLVMVVGRSGSELQSKLSAEWEFLMELELRSPTCPHIVTAVLIRPGQQLQPPFTDLPSKHCAAVSVFARRHGQTARTIVLRGWLIGSRAVQSLSSLPCIKDIAIADCILDTTVLPKVNINWPGLLRMSLRNIQLNVHAMSAITQAKWLSLRSLDLSHNMLGVAGVRSLVSCLLPSLACLGIEHAGIDAPALRCLAQGQWPALRMVNIQGNSMDANGVSYLVQGKWPELSTLTVRTQDLDEEAVLLLGLADTSGSRLTESCEVRKSMLPQFPFLEVWIVQKRA